MQIPSDLVSINVEMRVVEVDLEHAGLLTGTEASEVDFKSRCVHTLFSLVQGFSLFLGLLPLLLLGVTHLKDARVSHCVVHDRSLVDHLCDDFKSHIQCDAIVGVDIKVNVFEIELVVEGAG